MSKETIYSLIKRANLSNKQKTTACKALRRIAKTGEAHYMLRNFGSCISSFSWIYSKEGFAFWYNIDISIHDLNPNFNHFDYIIKYRKINRNNIAYKHKLI